MIVSSPASELINVQLNTLRLGACFYTFKQELTSLRRKCRDLLNVHEVTSSQERLDPVQEFSRRFLCLQLCHQITKIVAQVAKFVANISMSGKQLYNFLTVFN
ncbi:hypothetical protein AVEN_255343-1 [Araneus ventricosus]|uniref:Uncharacterized protein n=1 Tax=Araneus ventricosus TaxID=182803 RepID=A0A4Y2H0E4_ARAVE|nr:hypothetical protein AVEN_255343-1 [Araneus ventricosus]